MIDLERDGPVWVIRMRNDENRFNDELVAELHEALDAVEAADAHAALVTIGEGRFYSNGLDLEWMASAGERAGQCLGDVHRLLGRVLGFPAITVAAVNGHAFAAGAMFACAHDFVVMRADRGYWCLPEVDLGLPLTAPMYAVVSAKLPMATLHEVLVTGRRYGAEEAVTAGIVNEAVAQDQVKPRAVQIASALADKDRDVITEHKRLLYEGALTLCSTA